MLKVKTRLISLLLCFALLAPSILYADIDEKIDEAETAQPIYMRRLLIGLGIMAVGLIPMLIGSGMTNEDAKFVWVMMGGSVVAGGGLYMVFTMEQDPFSEADRLKRAKYSNVTERELQAIENRQIFIGMSEEALLLSWGNPSDINSSTGAWGVHKQYVYGDFGPYVYVENGKVTSWQD